MTSVPLSIIFTILLYFIVLCYVASYFTESCLLPFHGLGKRSDLAGRKLYWQPQHGLADIKASWALPFHVKSEAQLKTKHELNVVALSVPCEGRNEAVCRRQGLHVPDVHTDALQPASILDLQGAFGDP